MANKSFVVQYLIKAREHYSAAAEKVRRSSENMRKSVERSRKTFIAASAKVVVLKNKIKSIVPVFGTLSRKAVVLKNKIKSVIPSMSALNGWANRLKVTLKGVETRFAGVSAAGTKMRNMGIAMTAFMTVPIVFAAKALKNAARDAEETRSKFATVFKSIGPAAQKAADTIAKGYGLAGTKARELIGDTGDLLTGFGFTQKSALELSSKVTTLAVDLASFTNFVGGAEGASKALTKALLGERESVKSLGIAILEKDVKAKVALLVSKGQRFESMRQAKAIATLAIAVEQSKNAIGDFARTQEQLANQERITSSRMQDLKESFGLVLMPVALKLTLVFRELFVRLTALSPGTKKIILIIAALAAVLGPLLLLFGAITLSLPLLASGFAAFGAVAAAALGPVGVLALALAAAAVVVIRNWDKVRAFFSGFAKGFQTQFGPAAEALIENFRKAAGIIAGLFGKDSAVAQSLFEFANIGELIGSIIGGTLDLILRGLSGIGAIIGQVIAATVTLDFSQFDIESIKAEFLGAKAKPMLSQTRVDVGVNVGLDKGLTQLGAADVTGVGARRTDVGGLAQ